MTDTKQLFMAGVARAAEGSPCIVTATTDGFDVSSDLKDEMWLGANRSPNVDKIYVHRVRVQGSAYRILSDVRNLTWADGTPVPGRPRSSTYSSTFSLQADQPEEQAADSGVPERGIDQWMGRRLIEQVGEELGFIQHAPGSRLGLLLTGVALLVTVLVMFSVAAWVLFVR